MAIIEATAAQLAGAIDDMYKAAAKPAALPGLVESIIEQTRNVGHDEGVEAVAVYIDKSADEFDDGDPSVDDQVMASSFRLLASQARDLKKGVS